MIAVAFALIVVAAAVLAHRFWPHPTFEPVEAPASLLEQRVKEEFVVTLKSGDAFRGVLFEADDKAWVLRNAEALTGDKRPISVDGELVILTSNVAYANKP